MKSIIFILFYIVCFATAFSQANKVSMKEFQSLAGNWQGNLSYIDYTSNKSQTIAANINIVPLEKSRKLILANSYTNEPNANSTDTLTISEDGRKINKALVKSVSTLKNGKTEIITAYLGVDGNDNKPAIIKHVYIIGKTTFVLREEVQYIGENVWLERSRYTYARK